MDWTTDVTASTEVTMAVDIGWRILFVDGDCNSVDVEEVVGEDFVEDFVEDDVDVLVAGGDW